MREARAGSAETALGWSAAPGEPASDAAAAQATLWMFLATVVMLFAGFTSAYVVRRSTGADWGPIPMPGVLWLNTLALAAGSVTLEVARRRQRAAGAAAAVGWLLGTAALGLLFLAGQLAAWREFARLGLFVPSDPHSSFFYVLTAVHGLHLLGGLAALGHACRRAVRPAPAALGAAGLGLCATYWHFVGALWVWVVIVLFILG